MRSRLRTLWEQTVETCLKAGRVKVVSIVVPMVVLIALADREVGLVVSLGVLYILPMMIGAVACGPIEIFLLAGACAFLRSWFDTPATDAEAILRFTFALLAYFVSGLFVVTLVHNRRRAVDHLATLEREQALRREAEEQLKLLVESSPAAILTLDHRGTVLAANKAANALFVIPVGKTLLGRSITPYIPLLSDALGVESVEGFRTAAKCQGCRETGDIFLADTWFSSYQAPEGMRLAAIVVDSSEEMRDREDQNLRLLRRSNRIAAAAVSHEVRNLCGALSLLRANVEEKLGLSQDEDFKGFATLIKGLDRIARLELDARAQEQLEEVPLQSVLDNLRIVIEPDWQECDGVVHWQLPEGIPAVLADPSGLLQALLNLARNSHRAVQQSDTRELCVSVSVRDQRAYVRVQDSGPGVVSPESLFQPFQPGAEGTGLGLYVSRAVVRSYGGELRFEPSESGSRFVVELQVV
ncbi:MAG: HAMP domain-containing histidine kinase [Acidobacteriia bacterium]|nr:HAMP domain-containing histidine kinase [Terriglobia bacterium]